MEPGPYGTWTYGTWTYGTWTYGTWTYGTWIYGTRTYGTWSGRRPWTGNRPVGPICSLAGCGRMR
jgi:hypothetical protein